jgi:hypothetical protein
MAGNDGDFKPWPPADLVKEIQDAWKNAKVNGKHWAVQVDGTNPISGYRVSIQK